MIKPFQDSRMNENGDMLRKSMYVLVKYAYIYENKSKIIIDLG